MLTDYIQAAMRHARYEIIGEFPVSMRDSSFR
jgi:hypothetical protein